ncbi:hypothetical protein AEGHOMDF_2758 [Methylobacterium soli]|nr:hypothetical protein AEGHOMDF_2758 [Methylobacterium soli]
MTRRSQSSGFSSLRVKPPCFGSISSSRWMVLAASPVCSVMRLAARPVEAASSTCTPFAFRMRSTESRVLVLPTPGPPVMTQSFEPSISRTASTCEGESVLPVFCSTQGRALSRSISGQGGVPAARSISRSAMMRSDACSPLRKTQVSPSTMSATTSSPRNSNAMATRIRSASTSKSFCASTARRSVGKPQWPSSMAVWSAKETPARSRCGASFSSPSFIAMASAVRKPMPRISRASRYGSSVMTLIDSWP